MFYNVLTKYAFLFNVTLVTWKTKPVDIELHPGAKPYHSKLYPGPRAQEAIFNT